MKRRIFNKQSLSFQLFYRYLCLIAATYIFILFLIINHSHVDILDDYFRNVSWPAKTLLYETLGNENVVFKQSVSKEDQPMNVYHLVLESATNIKFEDVRSLFGSELPGFSLYNAKIFVAGKGVNYTNLPEESPPPPLYSLPNDGNAKNNDGGRQSSKKIKNKTVFIYHTHSWESYKPALKNKANAASAVSDDPSVNIIHAGSIFGQELEKNGIGFLHDTSNKSALLKKHNWDYNEAYQLSRGIVQSAMKKDRQLQYFIDIHRDSSARKLTTMTLKNTNYARLGFIIGEANPDYSANLYLAKQLNQWLEKHYPGISRGVIGKSKLEGNGVYNQDLSKNAVLVEIGGVDNTLAEVDRSSKALADALSAVIRKK